MTLATATDLGAVTDLATATNEHLANISNTLIYSAMAVYTLAFFAYIAEWIFGSRSKVARTAAALTTTEKAKTPAVTVQSAGGTAVLERPKVVTRSAAGARDVPDGPGAHGGDEQGDLYSHRGVPHRARLGRRGGRRRRPRAVGAAGAVGQHVRVQRHLLHGRRHRVPGDARAEEEHPLAGPALVTTVLLDLGLAVTVLYTASDQLVPALHSYWLYIHVSTAILCGAVFYVGAVGTLMYLFKDSYENKLATGGRPGRFATSVMERLPSLGLPRQVLLPRQRRRLPAVDLHDHRGRHLGGRRVGPLLGLGPEGDLGVHHLGRLRLLPPTPAPRPAGRAARPRTSP